MSDKVKRLLERFSAATIRAAMAENPAVMTASGWKSTPDGIEQSDVDEEGVIRLRESLKEIAMLPLLDTGMGLVSKIPAVQKFVRAIARGVKRNSREGRAMAENVKKALSKIDDLVSKSDAADINPELRELLLDEGVPADILTDANLEKLTRGRLSSLVNTADSAPSRFVIREGPMGGGARTYDVIEPGFVQENYYYPKNQVGYIQTEPSRYGDGPMVTYIENVTGRMQNPAKGVSETAYNAVIQDKGSLVSGELLLSPEKTMKVLDKYPNKIHLGNYGQWDSWKSGKTFNHPVYKLMEPTYEVPIKYGDVFSGYVIDDSGNFVVDYAGDSFHAMGGTLLRRYDMGGDKDGDGAQLYYNPSPDDIGVNFTVSPTVEPLHVETPYTPDDFFERWYPNRMQQIQNNMATVNRSNSKLFPNKKAGRDARPFVNSMLRNAKLVKEYTLLHPGYSTQERFFKFPNALKDSVARNVLNNSVRTTNRILKKEILEDYPDNDLRWEGFGTHGFSKTTYPHLIFYTDAEPSENTIVHERTHPLRPELGSKLGKNYMTYPWLSGDAWNPMEYKIATMLNQLMTTEKGRNLEPKKANYYFSPEEINARMNAIREQQNLNPKHKITKEDLQEIKKKASRTDRDGFLDLIDDDSLLRLFNEVADASTSREKRLHDKIGGVNSAALGGLIERYGKDKLLSVIEKMKQYK